MSSIEINKSSHTITGLLRRDTISRGDDANEIVKEYTVADVYDDAAVIGSELEKIITNYGSDVLRDLMPKVIHVLELLEVLTIKNEKENEEKNELKMRIHSLEYEKVQRNNEREKFEKELEEIEEKWQNESFKLIDMINKLKEDNKRLNDSLDQNTSLLDLKEHIVIKQEELDFIKQIKEENIKLKEMNRYKDRELDQRLSETEALKSQIETLTNTLLNFRRKNIVAQNQIDKMIKSKAELECTVTEREQQLDKIRAKLYIKSKTSEDQTNEENEYSRINVTTNEKIAPIDKGRSIEKSLKNEVTEMIMINAKDPDRPRFTLKELQKVLMEKNQLTVKLDQTQDELEQLRKGELANSGFAEVQGPINREPEEKLDSAANKAPPSGIRRFFSFFLFNNDGTFSSDNEVTAISSIREPA